MKRELYFLITAIIFTIVALAHLARIAVGWSFVIDSWSVPMWISWVATAVTVVLAYYGFLFSRKSQ